MPEMTMVERMVAAMKARASQPWCQFPSMASLTLGTLGDGYMILAAAALEAMIEPYAGHAGR
jgi:hypothetical protein